MVPTFVKKGALFYVENVCSPFFKIRIVPYELDFVPKITITVGYPQVLSKKWYRTMQRLLTLCVQVSEEILVR